MKDEVDAKHLVEKLRQEIEQEINNIAAGTNRANLPKNMGILIPSLDLQAAIDRIIALFHKAQVEAVRAELQALINATSFYSDLVNDPDRGIQAVTKSEILDRLAKLPKEDGETK